MLGASSIAAIVVGAVLALAILAVVQWWTLKQLQARQGYSNLEAQTGAPHHLPQGRRMGLWARIFGRPAPAGASALQEHELAQRQEGWMDQPGSVVLVPVPSDMSSYRS